MLNPNSPDAEASEAAILDSWHINAEPWSQLIQGKGIASRKAATNAAILSAIEAAASHSSRALDVGCGEGWLVREMTQRGINTLGIDAIPALIQRAQETSEAPCRFQVMTYADIAQLEEHFDLIVCNFSLFGDRSVVEALHHIAQKLTPEGLCLIQTLHPQTHQPGASYQTGWYPGSWKGFGSAFSSPAPWYFRTLSDWISTFMDQGLWVSAMHEPLHPETQQPASIIFGLRRVVAAHL
jgi:2-polyprenyl-3-methyl-5-hydroxy-6-metoxy-1,4-benzoquinol methylase